MRLNWFSPLPPEPRAGAELTRHLLPELARRSDVVLWTLQSSWDRSLERHAEVRPIGEAGANLWSQVHDQDVSIYGLDSDANQSSDFWSLSREDPGVVILHEPKLPELFWKFFKEFLRDEEQLSSLLERHYGRGAAAFAERMMESETSRDVLADVVPMTRLATLGALGVMVHSQSALKQLKSEFQGPVSRADVPYRIAVPDAGVTAEGGEKTGEGDLRVVVFGVVTRNRRVDSLIQALSAVGNRERYRIDVYGDVENRTELEEIARLCGVQALLHFHGPVGDETLRRSIASADLVANLDHPTRGGASYLQLRTWEHGAPSVALRSGWYGEQDPEAVHLADPGAEIEGLRAALEACREDPERCREMGARGRRLLEERHSPATYAQQLLSLAERSLQQRTAWSIRRASTRLRATPGLGAEAVEAASEVLLGSVFEPDAD